MYHIHTPGCLKCMTRVRDCWFWICLVLCPKGLNLLDVLVETKHVCFRLSLPKTQSAFVNLLITSKSLIMYFGFHVHPLLHIMKLHTSRERFDSFITSRSYRAPQLFTTPIIILVNNITSLIKIAVIHDYAQTFNQSDAVFDVLRIACISNGIGVVF